MNNYEKDAVGVSRSPGDPSGDPPPAPVVEGDIKRNLSSRHINMIALAGMIVRNQNEHNRVHMFHIMELTMSFNAGNWAVLKLG
jgi:hypothetical protein